MKYIWVIMLIISDLIWGMFAFSDIMVCIKSYKSDPHEEHNIIDIISELLDDIEDETKWFFIVHILVLFFGSLAYFIIGE